jgi:UDP-N-acetyl-D-glucosamine dehydrogenase
MSLIKTLELIQGKKCVIDIFGLGYVGFPLAIKLANSGFKVIGIDTDPDRTERLRKGILAESELILQKEFFECSNNGNFVIASSPIRSENPKIGIICVSTPIPNQSVQSNIFVKSAIENFLNSSNTGDIIIIESSIEVGTTDEMKQVIESKGFKVGVDFGLCFCPERIDPQNKKWKLENIPRIVFCSDDATFQIIKNIYYYVNNSNLIRIKSSKVAEIVKSFENTFRLVNISLVNELALLCDKLGVNAREVIDASSTKPFGFVPFYPSAGAGGHCIPKDPIFLLESAKKFDMYFKTIENALQINSFIPKYIADKISETLEENKLEKSVLVCGLTYKPDVEDMRDSSGFKILNELKTKHFRLAAYDPYYRKEIASKYLKENHLPDLFFESTPNLDDDVIKKFSCLCIVQNHTKTRFRLEEIYKKSLVPFIYDCQNKIILDPDSKTILKAFGAHFG